MSDVAIKFEGAGKKFCKSLNRSMFYGGLDILRTAIGSIPQEGQLRKDEFWAVEGLDFEIKQGESVGVMGPNGSGKTTLLKMLNGIFMPDKGKISITGRVGALIQVGAGFHPMLSGRENIYINATILGLNRQEIDRNFDSIVDFADIGDFLDAPVKYYSSGMYVRLGFAIAIHCRPDILLIDEILAVGDIKFHYKCLRFITEKILKSGCTVIFVSHDRYAIESICPKTVYLNKGKIVKIGPTLDVIGTYLDDVKLNQQLSQPQCSDETQGISKIEFLDAQGHLKQQFKSGETVKIRFSYHFNQAAPSPSIGITFNHHDPRFSLVSSTDYIFNLHSGYDGLVVDQLQGIGYFEVTVDALYIPVGIYSCVVCLYGENRMNLLKLYEVKNALEVLWTDNKPKRTLIELPHHWTFGQK